MLIDQCLDALGISSLIEWDVLVFLRHHHISLASAGNIARLLNYPANPVGSALDALESLGLIERSRSSQGVRLYRCVAPTDDTRDACFQKLLSLTGTRPGRLQLAGRLRRRSGGRGFEIIKGGVKWPKAV